MLELPTVEQQRRGHRLETEIFDAVIARAFEHTIDFNTLEFPELVQRYLNEEIDSVTAIYLAMHVDNV